MLARFEGHRDGFGFVNPTDGSRDVFIPPHRTGGALHGDLVEFEILDTRADGRRDGAVVRVVRPTGQRIVGLVSSLVPRVEIRPFDARAGGPFTLKGRVEDLEEGLAVEIEIGRGGKGGQSPARLLEVIGPITQPGVDIEVLIRKHHLRVPFPDDVMREAEALGREVPPEELASRTDFSADEVVTIDGDTAKDFDDAVAVSSAPGGGFTLSVHIADVAAYVRPGTAIDTEARLRGTSVYFPGRAIPMLPPALSEHLCSLRPMVPRLVQSVIVGFTADGDPISARFADGWIRSRARLTYGRVNALLEGATPGDIEKPLMPAIGRMRALAERLARRRGARGGLDFDLPEPEVVLDALGAAADVRPASRGPAQRLIEEFMIAANIAVARALREANVPVLHRVHERPDPAKVGELARVAAALGYRFDAEPENAEPGDFRRLLTSLSGRPEERPLGRLVLRTMALARYAPDPLGHFGLAAEDYLHFTSPIRRYPDLVAHRALRVFRARSEPAKGARRPGTPGSVAKRGGARASVARSASASLTGFADGVAHEELNHLAAECSRLERVAESAERESLAWKRAEVLLGRLGDTMKGTVTSTSSAGLIVELEEVYAEGLVPMATLPGDIYRSDRTGLALIGERTGRTFRAGDSVAVIIARVDRIGQRVELALPQEARGAVSSKPADVAEYASQSDRPRGGQPARGPKRARSARKNQGSKRRS